MSREPYLGKPSSLRSVRGSSGAPTERSTGTMTDYELIRSKRRSLELRVLEDGRVQVRAPQRASLRMVQALSLIHI